MGLVLSLPAPDSATTVLVTGASSGIGRELSRELARRGHHVTLVARRRDRLAELADELGAAEPLPCDLADARARGALAARLRAPGGRRVVGVCNNAGFGTFGRFDALPAAREAEQVAVNVDALHELTRAFVQDMVVAGTGAILNVASIVGFAPIASGVFATSTA